MYSFGGIKMKVKVIFHVDEGTKWNLLLKNVQNLLQVIEINMSQIEVLANSEAVKFYLRDNSEKGLSIMQDLSGKGVYFVACNNALRGFGITKVQLAPFVSIVPAGVLELIEKQMEGYAYIKP